LGIRTGHKNETGRFMQPHIFTALKSQFGDLLTSYILEVFD
jgi:hypothetical protein